jgi:hypothetical protein
MKTENVLIFDKAKYRKRLAYQIKDGQQSLVENPYLKTDVDRAEMKGYISGLKVALQILDRLEAEEAEYEEGDEE